MKTIQCFLLILVTLVSLNSKANTPANSSNIKPFNYSPIFCGHSPIKKSVHLYEIKNVKKHCGCFPTEAICVAKIKVTQNKVTQNKKTPI